VIPEFSPGAAEYESWHEQEENYAWASLAMGKPLVGQRVRDILALVTALQSYPATQSRKIYVAALGKLTVPALFAASLQPEIEGLYLAGALVSFASVVQAEVPSHPFANYVPDLLNHTDLPDVTAGLAHRKIVLAGTVDAMGRPLAVAAVQSAYESAVRAGIVKIAPNPDWSSDRLVQYARTEASGT
jgi:hypothetical protein